MPTLKKRLRTWRLEGSPPPSHDPFVKGSGSKAIVVCWECPPGPDEVFPGERRFVRPAPDDLLFEIAFQMRIPHLIGHGSRRYCNSLADQHRRGTRG